MSYEIVNMYDIDKSKLSIRQYYKHDNLPVHLMYRKKLCIIRMLGKEGNNPINHPFSMEIGSTDSLGLLCPSYEHFTQCISLHTSNYRMIGDLEEIYQDYVLKDFHKQGESPFLYMNLKNNEGASGMRIYLTEDTHIYNITTGKKYKGRFILNTETRYDISVDLYWEYRSITQEEPDRWLPVTHTIYYIEHNRELEEKNAIQYIIDDDISDILEC